MGKPSTSMEYARICLNAWSQRLIATSIDSTRQLHAAGRAGRFSIYSRRSVYAVHWLSYSPGRHRPILQHLRQSGAQRFVRTTASGRRLPVAGAVGDQLYRHTGPGQTAAPCSIRRRGSNHRPRHVAGVMRMLTTHETIMFCTGCSRPFDDGDPLCARCRMSQHKGHGHDVHPARSSVFHVGRAMQEAAATPRKTTGWRWRAAGAAATVIGVVCLIVTQSWQL